MKTQKNSFVEAVILGTLGLLVLLTLLIPQLMRDRRDTRLLSLSVLLRDTDSSNWNVARQGMEQAADELGAELCFLTLTVQNDTKEQEEILRREVEGGADALIAVPANPEALCAALNRLPDACPMIMLEVSAEDGAAAVAPDNEELGRKLAETLLEDWNSGKVLLLDNSAACPEVRIRLEAAREVLAASNVPAIEINALPDYRVPTRWAMTFEDGATRQAVENKETQGQVFTLYGVGSSTSVTSQLEKGNITAVAAWSDYAAGYLAVQQAVQAIENRIQELDPLPFSIVRGEDIYAPENQKLLFPVTS